MKHPSTTRAEPTPSQTISRCDSLLERMKVTKLALWRYQRASDLAAKKVAPGHLHNHHFPPSLLTRHSDRPAGWRPALPPPECLDCHFNPSLFFSICSRFRSACNVQLLFAADHG